LVLQLEAVLIVRHLCLRERATTRYGWIHLRMEVVLVVVKMIEVLTSGDFEKGAIGVVTPRL
jgi:hypothetical protein